MTSRKFTAYATLSYDLKCEFELDDEYQDPWEYALSLDGGEFSELDGTGDWKLYEIEEITHA